MVKRLKFIGQILEGALGITGTDDSYPSQDFAISYNSAQLHVCSAGAPSSAMVKRLKYIKS